MATNETVLPVSEGCDWKVVYQSLTEAEDAYHRTPALGNRLGFLLPYWCDEHNGFHLGHFNSLGKRARRGWGVFIYNSVNAYARVKRRKARAGAEGATGKHICAVFFEGFCIECGLAERAGAEGGERRG